MEQDVETRNTDGGGDGISTSSPQSQRNCSAPREFPPPDNNEEFVWPHEVVVFRVRQNPMHHRVDENNQLRCTEDECWCDRQLVSQTVVKFRNALRTVAECRSTMCPNTLKNCLSEPSLGVFFTWFELGEEWGEFPANDDVLAQLLSPAANDSTRDNGAGGEQRSDHTENDSGARELLIHRSPPVGHHATLPVVEDPPAIVNRTNITSLSDVSSASSPPTENEDSAASPIVGPTTTDLPADTRRSRSEVIPDAAMSVASSSTTYCAMILKNPKINSRHEETRPLQLNPPSPSGNMDNREVVVGREERSDLQDSCEPVGRKKGVQLPSRPSDLLKMSEIPPVNKSKNATNSTSTLCSASTTSNNHANPKLPSSNGEGSMDSESAPTHNVTTEKCGMNSYSKRDLNMPSLTNPKTKEGTANKIRNKGVDEISKSLITANEESQANEQVIGKRKDTKEHESTTPVSSKLSRKRPRHTNHDLTSQSTVIPVKIAASSENVSIATNCESFANNLQNPTPKLPEKLSNAKANASSNTTETMQTPAEHQSPVAMNSVAKSPMEAISSDADRETHSDISSICSVDSAQTDQAISRKRHMTTSGKKINRPAPASIKRARAAAAGPEISPSCSKNINQKESLDDLQSLPVTVDKAEAIISTSPPNVTTNSNENVQECRSKTKNPNKSNAGNDITANVKLKRSSESTHNQSPVTVDVDALDVQIISEADSDPDDSNNAETPLTNRLNGRRNRRKRTKTSNNTEKHSEANRNSSSNSRLSDDDDILFIKEVSVPNSHHDPDLASDAKNHYVDLFRSYERKSRSNSLEDGKVHDVSIFESHKKTDGKDGNKAKNGASKTMDSTVSESIRITFDKPKAKDASNNSASSSNKDGQQLLMTNQTSATEKEIQVDQSCPELEELSSPKKSHHVSSTISKGLSKNAATNSQHTASSLSIGTSNGNNSATNSQHTASSLSIGTSNGNNSATNSQHTASSLSSGTSNGNNTAGCERLQKESTMPMPPPLKRTTSAPTPTASVPSKALRDKKQIFDPRTEAVKISPKPIHKVTATVTDSLHLQESSSTSSPSTQGTGRQDAAKNKNIPPPTDQRSCNSTVTTKPDSGNSTPQNKEAVPNSPVCNIGFSGGEIRMLPASPVSKSVSNTKQSRNNNTTGNSRNSKDRDNARDSSSSERSRSNSGSRHESRNGQNYSNRGNSSSVRGSHRGGRSGRPTTQYPMSPPITPPDPSAPPLMSISDFDSPANETLRQQTSPPDSNNTKRGRRRNRRGGHYSQQTAPFGPRSPPFNNYEFENSNSGYRYPQQQQQQQHNPNYYPNAGRPYRGGGNQRSNWGGMPRGNARGRYQNFSAPQVQAYSYPWF